MPRAGWSELSALVAIAEQRSFRAAAQTLDVSPSALSHSIRSLEARLDVRLFNRTTRSVSLTEAGERLLNRVRPALADLDGAVDEVASGRGKPSGSIRISASESGTAPLVRNVLPDFLDRYPDIRLEFVTDTRLIDIVAAGFDAGIRVLEDVPRDMIAVRFGGNLRFVAVAAPSYLARHAAPAHPRELAGHRCIRFRFESGALYRWHFEHRGKSVSFEAAGPLTLGNLNLVVDAALAGMGIAWLPEDKVAPQLASGALIHVLPRWSPSQPGLCLYYPSNRHPPTALRLFVKAVRDWAGRPGAGRRT